MGDVAVGRSRIMARVGQTVTNRFPLRPGSNAAVAVAPILPVAEPYKLGQLAASLGAGIGATPVPAGERLGYDLYVIGNARPAVLRLMGTSDGLLKWYKRAGSPVGPDPEFYSINIDWRGPSTLLQWPADVFVLPAPTKTVHGEPNWPNLSAEGYRDMMAQAETDETISRVGGQIERHVKGAAEALSTPVKIAAGIGGALLAVFIISRVTKR